MADTLLDALGKSVGLVGAVDDDDDFLGIHDGANTNSKSSLGDLVDIVIEESGVGDDGVVGLGVREEERTIRGS